MTENSKTFSLRDLFISTACFAAAVGIVCFNNYLGDHGGDVYLREFLFLLAIPLVGAALGGGIGVLVRRFWRGSAIGALIAVGSIGVLAIFAHL